MPEEKQRKKRIRVEKLNEWIETYALTEILSIECT